MIQWADQDITLNIGSLLLTDVTGQLVNGKGETRAVQAKGVALADVLLAAGTDFQGIQQVTVTASDNYSVVVTAQEMGESGKAYLILQEDAALQLVVFGEQNSKRNVTNVIILKIEMGLR